MTRICVNKLGHHSLRYQYLNQLWILDNWTLERIWNDITLHMIQPQVVSYVQNLLLQFIHMVQLFVIIVNNCNDIRIKIRTFSVKNCPWYYQLQNGAPFSLRWRHNERDCVSNHQPHDCLLNHLFGRRSRKISKLRVTGLCVGNSPGTDEFPAQMASNAENVSIWWRHHVIWPHRVNWNTIAAPQKIETFPEWIHKIAVRIIILCSLDCEMTSAIYITIWHLVGPSH